MYATHAFIISWPGQHENAAAIAKSLGDAPSRLSIVYSDPDTLPACLSEYSVIRRDNRLFWADKFQACLEHCADDEIMLVIHADCRCDDWPGVIQRCKAGFARFAELGIWAPKLTGTPWRLQRTRIRRISGTAYSVVAQTDGLVFALSPTLYPRMKQADYTNNLYGLGIDWLFLCAAYAGGMTAITDEAITVHHPITRGYSTKEARAQKRAFLKQLSDEEQRAYRRLKAHMRPRKIFSKIMYWLECNFPNFLKQQNFGAF